MRTIAGLEGLETASGQELGVSEWWDVTQERVDIFAAVTGDDYWLHTDPEQAAESPMGTTVAHGLLTLGLGPGCLNALVTFEGFELRLNYGYEKVRFPAPLPVGSRVRVRIQLLEVASAGTGAQATLLQTFEREGGDKPVCVAHHVMRFVV